MSPCGQHPRPRRFQTEAESSSAGLPILLPSTVLWHMWEVQLWGEGEGSRVLGLVGLDALEGAGRRVQPVQESLRMRKEKGSLCVIALVGCTQDSP